MSRPRSAPGSPSPSASHPSSPSTPCWSQAATVSSGGRSTRPSSTRCGRCRPGLGAWRRSAPGRSSWLRPACSAVAGPPRIGGTPGYWPAPSLTCRSSPMRSSFATGTSYTSAGVSAGIDLALALVEDDHGTELVRDVARSLVVYLKRAGGQSQFSVLVEADPPPQSGLRAVVDGIAADPGADHSVKSLAAQASVSTRQLTRLFQSELGTTPARYRGDGSDRCGTSRPRRRTKRVGNRPSRRLRQRRNATAGLRQRTRSLTQGLSGQVPHYVAGLTRLSLSDTIGSVT